MFVSFLVKKGVEGQEQKMIGSKKRKHRSAYETSAWTDSEEKKKESFAPAWQSLRPEVTQACRDTKQVKFRIDDVIYRVKNGSGAYVDVFGVTENENSVRVQVENFEPYLCVQFPGSNALSKQHADEFVEWLEHELVRRLCEENHVPLSRYGMAPNENDDGQDDQYYRARDETMFDDYDYDFGSFDGSKRFRGADYGSRNSSRNSNLGRRHRFETFLGTDGRGLIKRWSRFKAFPSKPYLKHPRDFMRINVAYPDLVRRCKSIIEETHTLDECSVYEANIDFVLRYMVDMQMNPEEWWQLDNVHACAIPPSERQSLCQLEYRVRLPDFVNEPIAMQDARIKKPPLQLHRCAEPEYENKLGAKIVMSTDFEMNSEDGTFPKAERDPIIQMTAVFARHTDEGFDAQKAWANYVFAIGATDALNIPENEGETYLIHFPYVGDGTPEGERSKCSQQNAERRMLLTYQSMVAACDPDVITSYNGNNFDFPYYTERGSILGLQGFPFLGRLTSERSTTKASTKSSKAYGQIDSHETSMSGRVQLDMLDVLRKARKFRSYKLGAVSAEIIGDQKDDVSYHEIPIFQKHSNGRRKIAIYCLKDSQLVLYIVRKLIALVEQIQLAKTTGITMQSLLRRGTQFRNRSLMTREAAHNRVRIKEDSEETRSLPFLFHTKTEEETLALLAGEKYTGAIVIKSRAGYYVIPVITLDFSSLYPSIMRAHNYCPTTYVDLEAEPELTEDDYFTVPAYEELDDDGDDDDDEDENDDIPMFVTDPATGEEVPNLPNKFRLVYDENAPRFVHPHVREGLTPRVLSKLIAKRDEVKRKMGAEPEGSFMHDVYDYQQLAIKVCANSLYGLFGAPTSFATLIALALAVTTVGRGMLLLTQYKAEYCFVHFLRWLLYEKMGYTEQEKPIGILRVAGEKPVARGFYSSLRALSAGKKTASEAHRASVFSETPSSGNAQIDRANVDIKRIVPEHIPDWVLNIMIYQARLVKSWRFCARIVYGDTDSVFVKMKGCEGDDAINIGVIMTHYITLFFQQPNNLQFEKEFLRILLMKKKKYAGKKRFYAPPKLGASADEIIKPHAIWEDKKVSKSGVEAVRRDNCKMISETVSTSLDLLLESEDRIDEEHTRDLPRPLGKRERQRMMYRFVQAQLRKLKNGQVPFSQLIISKNLSKSIEAYESLKTVKGNPKDPPGHVKLAKNLQQRAERGEPVQTYNVGDRIPYVVVEFDKRHDKISNAYRDPLEAWNGAENIALSDYADNQLCKAMARIMAPFFRSETRRLDEKRTEAVVLSKTRDIIYAGDIIDANYGVERRIENAVRYKPDVREKSATLSALSTGIAEQCIYCGREMPRSTHKRALCSQCAHSDTGELVLHTLKQKHAQEQRTKLSLMKKCNDCFSKRYGFAHSNIVNHCRQTECDVFWDRALNSRNHQHYTRMLSTVMQDRAAPITDIEDLF